MDMERSESRREGSFEIRDPNESPRKERWEGGYDEVEDNGNEKSRDSSKHRSKDRSKSSSRKEEKEHPRSRDRERLKGSDVLKENEKERKYSEKDRVSSRDRRKEDRDEREKDQTRDKGREKDSDRDKYKDKDRERERNRKDRGKEKDRERETETGKDSERGRDKERGKEKSRDRDKEIEKERDRVKEREKEKYIDREKEKGNDRSRDRDVVERDKGKDKFRDKEREGDQDKERPRERDRGSRKQRDEGHDRSKDDKLLKLQEEGYQDRDIAKQGRVYHHHDEDDDMKIIGRHEQTTVGEPNGSEPTALELKERTSKMKEERLKKKSEGASEILSWVNSFHKLQEKKNTEKEKAFQLSKMFEEQDNINQDESEDEARTQHTSQDLAGVKVLHGLDKVIEGGAVVLTLKDQSILADGDINEEVDMLENVEIGEQKRRDDAYSAVKKITGIYYDKFNDEPGSEKKMLPQYDDPVVEEGVTLDSSGHFTGDAERKLEELRRRIQGVSTNNLVQDLNLSGKISSDYFTHEEMLQFKKPKKKKSLRKREKLDIDALEADALSAGLGVGDLGSRNNGKRQALREEQERSEAEMRSNAYQSALAKADMASKALRLGQILTASIEEDDTPVFGDDDEDLRKSLERARKLSLKKQDHTVASGPQAIALLASSTANNSTADNQNSVPGESQENKVVFTEMEEFVWGLQLDDESRKPDVDDVFMEEDVAPKAFDQEEKDEDGGWTEINDAGKDETPANEVKEEILLDETIHEVAVGKGLSGALKLLKDRGTLKESIEWGGRNMDKKKSKLVGLHDNDGPKEIRIERTDEYGRILTPKEAFRLLSHKFHGKGPGKMKQEKRMRQYQEELKVKQMKNADTPSLSVARMREAQVKNKAPYLVLSGHVKPGQTSDPRSGFATVENDLPGGLTPMLGDRKVEHFLGIKRKSSELGDMGPPKKPKT